MGAYFQSLIHGHWGASSHFRYEEMSTWGAGCPVTPAPGVRSPLGRRGSSAENLDWSLAPPIGFCGREIAGVAE